MRPSGELYKGNWNQILIGCMYGMNTVKRLAKASNIDDCVWQLNVICYTYIYIYIGEEKHSIYEKTKRTD